MRPLQAQILEGVDFDPVRRSLPLVIFDQNGDPISMEGTEGPQGPAGPTGATGATGAAGATGPAGPGIAAIYRKATAASATVPAGTNIEDTGAKVSFTLASTRLCLLIGRAGHSDVPSNHTFDWALDGVSFNSIGNNTSSVAHSSAYVGNSGATSGAASESQGAAALGGGHWRILSSGAHVWTHRTTRGSAGGTMQDRVSIVVVFDIAITDQ